MVVYPTNDYVIELLSVYPTIMMHLSHFSRNYHLELSNEYKFVSIDDGFSTGSSIMPPEEESGIAGISSLVRTQDVYVEL